MSIYEAKQKARESSTMGNLEKEEVLKTKMLETNPQAKRNICQTKAAISFDYDIGDSEKADPLDKTNCRVQPNNP